MRFAKAAERLFVLWFEWWDLFKKHKIVVGGSTLLAAYFIYLGLVILIGKKFGLSVFFQTHTPKLYSSHKYLYDFFLDTRDVHEIALGVGGVMIGFFITLMIERSNSEKSKALSDETQHIRRATEEIQKLTVGVAKDIKDAAIEATKLEVITDYSLLLKRIAEVTEHAKKSDGPFLIMNLTASFGYFLTFDSDRILGTDHLSLKDSAEERRKRLNAFNQLDYFRNWNEKVQTQRANFAALCSCVVGPQPGRPKKLVRYATLRASLQPGETPEQVPFEANYLHLSLEKAQVEVYTGSSADKFSIKYDDDKKLYLIPQSELSRYSKPPATPPVHAAGSEDNLTLFKRLLVEDQADKIQKLKNNNADVFELEETPFQLFLSLPGKSNESGICLFMFVNQHTISKTNRLAAFVTTDREILSAFRAIFDSLTNTTTPIFD